MPNRGQRFVCTLLSVSIVVCLAGCSRVESNSHVPLPDIKAQHKPLQHLSKQPSLSLSRKNHFSRSIDPNDFKKHRLQASNRHRRIGTPNQPIKGIYVSGWIAGSKSRFNKLVKLIDDTDLNAMVIDIKNDYGQLTYRSKLREVNEIGAANQPAIANIEGLMKRLKSRNIYVIGRIVAFKDPLYGRKKPSLALQKRSGGVWTDHQGNRWLNPFQPEVRSYNIAIAREAAKLGFDEIQFDYVRFPDNGAKVDREVKYDRRMDRGKAEIIGDFLSEARRQVHEEGARVSADVFGLVTSYKEDLGIGQTWREIASAVDVISPMTYPSHYSKGMYGISRPDLQPYSIIRHAMMDARQSNAILRKNNEQAAEVRPWLQGFTASWVHPHQRYGAEQIHKQIQAAKEQGVNGFLLWSSNCRYDYRSSI
ncbi:putative glycoside hydrolase [Paenibacillus oenotherae]|uniref:Glycoside hydrolase n=1 Tax=Paenibacillus oenotherae TaxID=1435645 RepID=A0ABS7D766_9BACL|nr:putative glycoside hydrolase [Paenibacillus oenotherae]MBW7475618.1 putative glycoside hydrolase [Paenibacillus oenotherae]